MAATTTDCVYAAGFFDGEGCVTMHIDRRPRRRRRQDFGCLRVQITNTNRDILEWHRGLWGGWIYDHGRQNDRHQQRWQWQLIAQEGTARFLRDVQPYLRVKTEQARIALYWIDSGAMRQGRAREVKTVLTRLNRRGRIPGESSPQKDTVHPLNVIEGSLPL